MWTRLSRHDENGAPAETPRREPHAVKWAIGALAARGGDFAGYLTDADTGAIVAASKAWPDALVVDPDRTSNFYLATDRGVYKSTDRGAAWRNASAGL
jgi:hypothetical protein